MGLKLARAASIQFRTIVMDPPWYLKGGGKIKRGSDKHYPLLKNNKEIFDVVSRSGVFNPHPDGCHMYLWVVNNFLIDGLELMAMLNFRYITNIVWVKNQIGLGQYFRGKHELCLFGVRQPKGKPALMTRVKKFPTVIEAPKTRHSAKPDAFYKLVQAASHPPRVELFSRRRRAGWDAWGDEV